MSDALNWFRRLLLAALALLLMAAWGLAEPGSGKLQGQVTDTSGAAIPALTVVAVDAAGAAHEAQTNEEGRYTFSQLPPELTPSAFSSKGLPISKRRAWWLPPARLRRSMRNWWWRWRSSRSR